MWRLQLQWRQLNIRVRRPTDVVWRLWAAAVCDVTHPQHSRRQQSARSCRPSRLYLRHTSRCSVVAQYVRPRHRHIDLDAVEIKARLSANWKRVPITEKGQLGQLPSGRTVLWTVYWCTHHHWWIRRPTRHSHQQDPRPSLSTTATKAVRIDSWRQPLAVTGSRRRKTTTSQAGETVAINSHGLRLRCLPEIVWSCQQGHRRLLRSFLQWSYPDSRSWLTQALNGNPQHPAPDGDAPD